MQAESRKKQKISQDPQNMNWVKDKSKFGFKMLEKMGWSEGKGLGKHEDGAVSHIKTSQKDALGIDVASNRWKDHASAFAEILEKLNDDLTEEAPWEERPTQTTTKIMKRHV
jgi:Pin2-interacting protein X1